jgi:4-hydroxybenzoate polyprenyltransferase
MSASPEGAPWLVAWLRERVLASWMLLVPLAIAVALVGGERDVALRAVPAHFAIIALRLWDDLEDIEHDRRHHPSRVLCRLRSLRSVAWSSSLALGLAAGSIVAVGGSLVPFGVAVATLSMAYLARRRIGRPGARVLFAHLILTKVPALALALACPGAPAAVSFGRALALYGVVGAYELAHDQEARRSPFAPRLALMDAAGVLAGAALWLLSR